MNPAASGTASRRVIVTGGGGGIGAAIVRRFCEAGDNVLVADSSSSSAEACASGLAQARGRAVPVQVDVTSAIDIQRMVSTAQDELGGADVLVNCAGVMPRDVDSIQNVGQDDWDRVIAVNLTGAFLCMKYAHPLLIESDAPSIVNISSRMGLRGIPTLAAYAASKHGLVGLTKVAALDLADDGFRVNAVCPGPIGTDMLLAAPDRVADVEKAVPMSRTGTPQEVANVVYWLAGPDSGFVTGTTVSVDGGLTA